MDVDWERIISQLCAGYCVCARPPYTSDNASSFSSRSSSSYHSKEQQQQQQHVGIIHTACYGSQGRQTPSNMSAHENYMHLSYNLRNCRRFHIFCHDQGFRALGWRGAAVFASTSGQGDSGVLAAAAAAAAAAVAAVAAVAAAGGLCQVMSKGWWQLIARCALQVAPGYLCGWSNFTLLSWCKPAAFR